VRTAVSRDKAGGRSWADAARCPKVGVGGGGRGLGGSQATAVGGLQGRRGGREREKTGSGTKLENETLTLIMVGRHIYKPSSWDKPITQRGIQVIT
jgi:hypothetical protein